jgi:hypothetical protein
MGLQLLHRGPLEYHYLRTKFHENLLRGTKVISGGHADRQPFLMLEVTFNVIITIHNFIQIHESVKKLHPPQKFKRPPFWSDRHHLRTKRSMHFATVSIIYPTDIRRKRCVCARVRACAK